MEREVSNYVDGRPLPTESSCLLRNVRKTFTRNGIVAIIINCLLVLTLFTLENVLEKRGGVKMPRRATKKIKYSQSVYGIHF